MPEFLLNVWGLETQFKTPKGLVHATNGVSFDFKGGEALDMIGKSGCGMNVAMLSVLGLIPDSPGKGIVGKVLF